MFEDNELLDFAVKLDPRVKTVMFNPAGATMNFEFWDSMDAVLYAVRIDPVRFNGNMLETLKECLIIEYKNREANKMPDYSESIQQLIDEGTDAINHPSHYTQYKGVEVIQISELLNFNRGNALKYIARAGFKNADTEIQDLEKAIWYLKREMDRYDCENSFDSPFSDKENIQKAYRLIEQMNYHRGRASYLAIFSGRIEKSVYENLEEAAADLSQEIERLKRDYAAV